MLPSTPTSALHRKSTPSNLIQDLRNKQREATNQAHKLERENVDLRVSIDILGRRLAEYENKLRESEREKHELLAVNGSLQQSIQKLEQANKELQESSAGVDSNQEVGRIPSETPQPKRKSTRTKAQLLDDVASLTVKVENGAAKEKQLQKRLWEVEASYHSLSKTHTQLRNKKGTDDSSNEELTLLRKQVTILQEKVDTGSAALHNTGKLLTEVADSRREAVRHKRLELSQKDTIRDLRDELRRLKVATAADDAEREAAEKNLHRVDNSAIHLIYFAPCWANHCLAQWNSEMKSTNCGLN